MGAGHAHALFVHEHSRIHHLAPEAKLAAAFDFIKRLSAAIPSFVILRFDIRYSAVRSLIQASKLTV